jgi:alpha-tubulin suppressor-like RCC1 family protein
LLGHNEYGGLGDGTSLDRTTPVPVTGLQGGVAQIAKPGASCVRTTAGKAQCWGTGVLGQLGNGTSSTRAVPVYVVGLDGVVFIDVLGECSLEKLAARAID